MMRDHPVLRTWKNRVTGRTFREYRRKIVSAIRNYSLCLFFFDLCFCLSYVSRAFFSITFVDTLLSQGSSIFRYALIEVAISGYPVAVITAVVVDRHDKHLPYQ